MGLPENSSSNNRQKRRGASAAASSSSAASNMKTIKDTDKGKATLAQYNADAGLLAAFERSDRSSSSFDYSKSVRFPPQSVPEEQIATYLTKIQRGGYIQPFGCMLAVEEGSLRIIGYSENCFDLLGLNSVPEIVSKGEMGLVGMDARTLFTPPSGASLARAAAARELSFLNPVWVYSSVTNKPFYAILHRVDVGIVVDLEPARSSDPAFSRAGAVQSQKLAVQAISRLQSLPGGDIGVLCDTVVEDVQRLTGYDRVMVYKFHDDEHGEVVSEIRRLDLEPYLGLHYPATDIPQAARFLFKQNRVRMIYDCNANQVRVIQSEELKQPLLLSNSTLRSPHGCHRQYMANMSSIASLVLSVTINCNYSTKLWGLVVCHHTSPRYVPFPQRYACEFLMQAFGLQLYMELQLAAQLQEKKVLRTQTLLCDMLLRDAPLGIVTQSPSIMDLVRCDGAALFYGGQCWLLGVTPTESQVKDIVKWLLDNHGDSTALTTESMTDAGYPGAVLLGDAVCGMATARISSQDFLFWFRSHTAKEMKWGGAKHHLEEKDDGGRMHPRSSFKAFLEVVKSRSLPWEVSEINAIHSLQLIMRDSLLEMEDIGAKLLMVSSQHMDTEMEDINELSSVASEMVRLIETATAPIFGVDLAGLVNGWNAKVAKLTGLETQEAVGKSLFHDIIHEDSRGEIESLLTKALQGEEEKNVDLKLRTFGPHLENSVVFVVVNACTSRDYRNNIIGVCFVGQDITREKIVTEKFVRLEGDYKAIIHSLNPLVPPLFASDENACCSEWNTAMQKLTGWSRPEVIGKVLPGEIFGGLCQLRDQDSLTKFMILLYKAISGRDTEKLQLGVSDRDGNFKDVVITANRRSNAQGDIIGCFCFLQIMDSEVEQHPLEEVHRQEDGQKWTELAYIRQQMMSPLSGIRFTHMLLETTAISEYQKQFLEASDACGRQIMAIIQDAGLGSIEQGKVELCTEEFILGNVLDAVVSQVMISVMEKQMQLLHEVPDEAKTLSLYGDQIRLQLVLSNFLLSIVHHTPSPNGWVEIKVSPGLKLIQDGRECIRLQFRMTHPGEGLPCALVQDVVECERRSTSQEVPGLSLSRKLLNMMNGRVSYNREQNKCYFLIDLEFRTKE